MNNVNYRTAFLLGISLIAVGTSLLSLMHGTAIGPVFIAIGGLFMLLAIRRKSQLGAGASAQSRTEYPPDHENPDTTR